MGTRCGKRFSSATASVNANRKLLREDTTVTETINKDDSISQFGPEKLEKSYCSSNSTSNLAVPETRGCVVIPESKRNENCNDSQDTFETKEIKSLGVVATRCDEPLAQTFVTKNPDKCSVENVSTASSERISHETDKIKDSVPKKSMKRKTYGNNVTELNYNERVKPRVVGGSNVEITLDLVVPETTGCCMIPESKRNENSNDIPNAFEMEIESPDDVAMRCDEPLGQTLKDSVPKIPMKRKMNGNNATEGHCNKRVKTTAVGDSEVEVNYRDGTKMLSGSGNLNSFSTDGTFTSSCNSISINSSSTGEIFINSCNSISINSSSTGKIFINSCNSISINSSSTGKIFINSNVPIKSTSTGGIFIKSSVPINSGSIVGKLIDSNVRVNSSSTGRIFINSSKNVRINSSSTGGIFINYP